MNLGILKECANFFKTFKKISYIGRIDDNLIKLSLDNQAFYIDLEKSKSMIFCIKEAILSTKKYKAPFDFALQKFCLKADIVDCKIDGNNRIMLLYLYKKLEYKEINCILQLEFTGKYTNAIILDYDFMILEALRKITQNSRIVKVGVKLSKLPQQENFKSREVKFDDGILDFLSQNYNNLNNQNLENLKKNTISLLVTKKEKLQKLLQNLPNKESLLQKSRMYSKIGLLMQNNMDVKFIGNEITLKDYDDRILTFKIDENVGFKSNALLMREFFTKSKKLKVKSRNILFQEENLKDSVDFLDAKIDFVKRAKTINDIKIINPKNKQNMKSVKEKSSYEIFFIDGIKISVGKNKNENIALLKDAKSHDIWMHTRDIPSSHLIIHTSKNNIRDDILQKSAEILVSFLKVQSGNFIIDYTRRKFVKIKEGANVVYSNYSTLNVKK